MQVRARLALSEAVVRRVLMAALLAAAATRPRRLPLAVAAVVAQPATAHLQAVSAAPQSWGAVGAVLAAEKALLQSIKAAVLAGNRVVQRLTAPQTAQLAAFWPGTQGLRRFLVLQAQAAVVVRGTQLRRALAVLAGSLAAAVAVAVRP